MTYLTDINTIQLKEITKSALMESNLKSEDINNIYNKLINTDIYNNSACIRASKALTSINSGNINGSLKNLNKKLNLLLQVTNAINNLQNDLRAFDKLEKGTDTSALTQEELEPWEDKTEKLKKELQEREKSIMTILDKIKL